MVLDLELASVVGGVADVGQQRRGVEVDDELLAVTEGGVQLGQGAGQRAVLVGTGDGQDGAGGRGQGEALGGGEPPGPGQLPAEVGLDRLAGHDDLQQARRASRAAARSRRPARARGPARPRGWRTVRETSAIGASPTVASQPTMASSRRSRTLAARARDGPSAAARAAPRAAVRATGAGPAAGAAGRLDSAVTSSWLGPWPPTTAPARPRRSGGPTTSAWSSSPRTHERMASVLVTPSRRSTDPSWRCSTTASAPTSSHTRGASMASTSSSTSSSPPSPGRHGSAGAAVVGVEPLGQRPLPGAPGDWDVLDPVDPEGPRRRPVARSQPDQVPPAAPEPQPGRGHRRAARRGR